MGQIDLGICTCRVGKDISLSLSKDISKLEINQCFNPFTLFWWVCFSVVSFGFFSQRICSSVMATHSQLPENAVPETIEADERERNDSVYTAVEWVSESLNTMLRDLDPTDQCQADKMLG